MGGGKNGEPIVLPAVRCKENPLVCSQSNNYQEVEGELSPLQEEAIWCAVPVSQALLALHPCPHAVTAYSHCCLARRLEDSVADCA